MVYDYSLLISKPATCNASEGLVTFKTFSIHLIL